MGRDAIEKNVENVEARNKVIKRFLKKKEM
jgi:hypothetical protein